MEVFQDILNFFQSGTFRFIILLFLYCIVVVWLSFVYWTYRDANQRGANGILWALVVLILNFFGLLIYLILRPSEYIQDVMERELEIEAKERLKSGQAIDCPACGNIVENDFLVCPYCRKKLKNPCPKCGKPLQLNWSICPYCKTVL